MLILFILSSCKKEDVDREYPGIDFSIAGAFPAPCDTLMQGVTYTVKIKLTDNQELGSYSVDIHHNFDHHSHSTEVQVCQQDPKKDPVDPFLHIEGRDIPPGKKEHVTDLEITVPVGTDTGDYHFMIRVTDEEGWQTMKGYGIKILNQV